MATDWTRIERILEQVLDSQPQQRTELLHRLCEGDHELEHRLRHMLRECDSPSGFLECSDTSNHQVWSAIGSDTEAKYQPTDVGKYHIQGVLGTGGMGVVYLAEQTSPHRVVALKILKPELVTRLTMQRFEVVTCPPRSGPDPE